jgi:hypothetical protein
MKISTGSRAWLRTRLPPKAKSQAPLNATYQYRRSIHLLCGLRAGDRGARSQIADAPAIAHNAAVQISVSKKRLRFGEKRGLISESNG